MGALPPSAHAPVVWPYRSGHAHKTAQVQVQVYPAQWSVHWFLLHVGAKPAYSFPCKYLAPGGLR
jgi:hypothetical protein